MYRQHINRGALALVLGAASGGCEHIRPPDTSQATPGVNTGSNVPPAVTTPSTNPMATVSAVPAAPVGHMEQASKAALCTEAVALPLTPGFGDLSAAREQAQSIVSRMTVEQKRTQLTGVPRPNPPEYVDIQRSLDDPDLGIKGYQWRDGPHGVNLESGLGRPGLANWATSFPTSVAQAATFDLDVVHRVGEAIADETVAAGYNVLLGPCMNILRHPYWGRAQETFGEDSFHLGRIATAFTVGLQQFVSGCAKHYAANNIESSRFNLNAQMDEQTLREIYARHFEMVVEDGGVGCVMAAYNSVNGVKSTQNKHLLRDILRDDFGFQGFVLTDWWSMPAPSNGQGPVLSPNDAFNAVEALNAGLNVEVPWQMNYDAIPQVISDGSLDSDVLDQAVTEVLTQKIRFNSLELEGVSGLKTPTTRHDDSIGAIVDNQHHVDLAREMAEKAMVLLKNDSTTLPIRGVTSVAVIGAQTPYNVPTDNPSDKVWDWIEDIGLGDRGSSRVSPNPDQMIGPLAGLQQAAPEGVTVTGGRTAADAMNADFVVVMVGLTSGDEGEEYTGASDRESLTLAPAHNQLINEVAALGKPMVVVIQAGAVVDMPWLSSVPAAVMAWYPGQAGGAALGNLLFGHTNFAGRLPVTWPQSVDQLPVFNEGTTTVMDYHLGYRHFDYYGLEPLFPFGHGLSYSTFTYDRFYAPCAAYTEESTIQLEVTLTNTSAIDGEEVVQVYASFPETTARRSLKELKAFERVSVPAGQSVTAVVPIRVADLKYWQGDENGAWVVEKGPVLLQVGSSAGQLMLSETVTIQ